MLVWASLDGGLSGKWYERAAEAPEPFVPTLATRRKRRRTYAGHAALADESAWGAALPACPRCDGPLVWRGQWRCDGCVATIPWAEYSGGARRLVRPLRALPATALAGRPFFSTSEGNNSVSSGRHTFLRWLEAVEGFTSWFRKSRAARHLSKAARSFWHQDRVGGQARRFERVSACGEPLAEMVSNGGGPSFILRRRCDCWRVCPRCLNRRRSLLQSGIEGVDKQVRRARFRELSKGYRGPEGRWSPKLVTFTVPHSGSPRKDAEALARGWAELSKKWALHLKKDRGSERAAVWVRALEIAPSKNGGHAHLHVWYVGPFVEHAWLRAAWGDVLEARGIHCPKMPWGEAIAKAVDARAALWLRTRRGPHGRERAELPWPVVDVRAARDSGAAAYAAKVGVHAYVMKGSKGEYGELNPAHAASIYEGLEGRRVVQWARGWAPKKPPSECTWRMQRISEATLAELREKGAAQDAARLSERIGVGGGNTLESGPPRREVVPEVRGAVDPLAFAARGGLDRGMAEKGTRRGKTCRHFAGVTSRDPDIRGRVAEWCDGCGQMVFSWGSEKKVFRPEKVDQKVEKEG